MIESTASTRADATHEAPPPKEPRGTPPCRRSHSLEPAAPARSLLRSQRAGCGHSIKVRARPLRAVARPRNNRPRGQPLRRDCGEAPTTGQAGCSLPREPPAPHCSEVQFELPRPIRRCRLSWAELLKRVLGIAGQLRWPSASESKIHREALRCPCGKQVRVLAARVRPSPFEIAPSGRRSPRDQPPSPPRYRPRLADRGLDSLTLRCGKRSLNFLFSTINWAGSNRE